MTADETDSAVIAASLDRSERFEAIFDRHSRVIYRYLRRRVGAELADELTAETFFRALVCGGNLTAVMPRRCRGYTASP
jgi:DNA-directed RNA polymerase specialized sigma24 family protein